ncbi:MULTISPECIES: DUF3310 domain-containing protein [unclassified Acidovorax]|uniref:DUF3310 domain-containing protein n=1 Tax=unclassified Acidovorax TaxID=2684926 RepID=UPI000B401A8C|nr:MULTISPECIES: DUF3310 domain-containing protein [unclassified Acidovorax]
MSALDTQIGGNHYKNMPIQPMQYSMANELDACQHTIIKYVTRFREKGGIQDLEKAKHVIDMLIEFEQNGVKPAPAQKPFDFDAKLNETLKDSAEAANTKKPLDFGAMLRDAIEAAEAAEAAKAAMPAGPYDCPCAACTLRRKLSAMFPDAEIDVTFLSEDTGRAD